MPTADIAAANPDPLPEGNAGMTTARSFTITVSSSSTSPITVRYATQ